VNYWGFVGLCSVLVAIPGPAVTLVMKRSILGGRSEATRTALGVLAADLFWALASVAGLTAILVASQPVFETIRLLGALYLCWLGLNLLLRRRSSADPTESIGDQRRRLSAFAEGALCDLTNPKTLLVFTSVIPQFLPTDGGHPIQALSLGVTFALLGFVSAFGYALVFSRIGIARLRSRVGDALFRIGGLALLAFGVRLAVEPTS